MTGAMEGYTGLISIGQLLPPHTHKEIKKKKKVKGNLLSDFWLKIYY